MSKVKLNPYIARDGDARQLLEFYHKILGGKLNMMSYADAPGDTPPTHKDRVMHGHVDNGGAVIMASDAPPGMPLSSTHSNISLSLDSQDEETMRKIFGDLSDGGKVTMPLEKQFWGDTFGMVDDKFGVHWMVNISQPETAKA